MYVSNEALDSIGSSTRDSDINITINNNMTMSIHGNMAITIVDDQSSVVMGNTGPTSEYRYLSCLLLNCSLNPGLYINFYLQSLQCDA